MNSDWNRIEKDFLFEKSIRDKRNRQITLLQSWRKIVAIIIQPTKTMVRTKKHYSYNVDSALDKLCKRQKLNTVVLAENDMYTLLIDNFGEEAFFKNYDDDIEFCEGYDEKYEPEDDEEDDDNPWDDYDEDEE